MGSNVDTYTTRFNGNRVELFNLNGTRIRQFNVDAPVVGAQVSGFGRDAIVTIQTAKGNTYIYKQDGRLMRRL